MKPGFLDALLHAARTGEIPDQPLQPSLEDQLVQSLAYEQGKNFNRRGSTSTYSTGVPAVPAAGAAGAAPAVPSPAQSSVSGGSGGSGKGQTLDQLFGEEMVLVAPERVVVPFDADYNKWKDTQRAIRLEAAGGPMESPSLGARRRVGRTIPRGTICPMCQGTRWVGGQPCQTCGGRGRLHPEQAEDAVDVQQARVDAALAREVDVPLPGLLVGGDSTSGLTTGGLAEGEGQHDWQPVVGVRGDVSGGADRAVAGAGDPEPLLVVEGTAGATSATGLTDLPRLTYDLPILVDDLPSFCYVAGPAGTGKTFWAKALAALDPEGCVLAATTGIAAVNLGEGTTINSLLRYYNTDSLREAFTGGWLEGQLVRLRRAGLRRILLDEVSMLDGDQLTILCRAIDNVNQARTVEEDPELGLILVGDFAQLPPVRAPFAFESAEWARFKDNTYRLTTIRRQADRDFVEALQAVRRGDALKALEFFRDRIQSTTAQHFDGPTILAKNDAVEKYNQLRLDKVTGEALSFQSSRWGKLRSEWGGPPKPQHEWDIPETLKLKVGARVMMLANRNIAEKGAPRPDYLYTNGDLGTVLGAEHGTCQVQMDRTGDQVSVVPITRENLIPLEPGRRKELKALGQEDRISETGKHEVIGAISYLPLRLAWATTVHKSQGLTLDQVQVNIRDSFFSQGGMLYVALSRARTAEGLRLVGTPEGFRARCSVHKKVLPWL